MRSVKLIPALAIPAALAASLALAGCASPSITAQQTPSVPVPSDNAAELKDVKVTTAGPDKAPQVSVPSGGVKLDGLAMKKLSEGDGDEIKPNSTLTLRVATFNATDGTPLQENFSKGPDSAAAIPLNDSLKQNNPVPYNKFVGAKVGSYFLTGVLPQSSQSGAQPATVEVYYVEADKPLTMPDDQVNKLDSEGKLPKVSFDDKQVPSIDIPKTDAPTDLVAKVLKPSTGDVIKSTDSINVYYKGWTWSDGKVFDENYSKGQPFNADLNGKVIQGWINGLAGQHVGSTVMLVIPAAQAYGDTPSQQGAPSGPLVFVVNISSKSEESSTSPAAPGQ